MHVNGQTSHRHVVNPVLVYLLRRLSRVVCVRYTNTKVSMPGHIFVARCSLKPLQHMAADWRLARIMILPTALTFYTCVMIERSCQSVAPQVVALFRRRSGGVPLWMGPGGVPTPVGLRPGGTTLGACTRLHRHFDYSDERDQDAEDGAVEQPRSAG
jgi:hypothetical protein